MHSKLTQIHQLQPTNSYFKKCLPDLHSLNLQLANKPTNKPSQQH